MIAELSSRSGKIDELEMTRVWIFFTNFGILPKNRVSSKEIQDISW